MKCVFSHNKLREMMELKVLNTRTANKKTTFLTAGKKQMEWTSKHTSSAAITRLFSETFSCWCEQVFTPLACKWYSTVGLQTQHSTPTDHLKCTRLALLSFQQNTPRLH